MDPFRWTCPFCDHKVIMSNENFHASSTDLMIENAEGFKRAFFQFLVCPNPECKKFTFYVSLHDLVGAQYTGWSTGEKIKQWRLIPPLRAKVFPEYVPEPIRDDYLEACLIRDLSPKASATLSRRCLQGMIRDFWGVTKANLKRKLKQ